MTRQKPIAKSILKTCEKRSILKAPEKSSPLPVIPKSVIRRTRTESNFAEVNILSLLFMTDRKRKRREKSNTVSSGNSSIITQHLNEERFGALKKGVSAFFPWYQQTDGGINPSIAQRPQAG